MANMMVTEVSDYPICNVCRDRHIDPDDRFIKGPRQGQTRDKCRVCRTGKDKLATDMFPPHLMVGQESNQTASEVLPMRFQRSTDGNPAIEASSDPKEAQAGRKKQVKYKATTYQEARPKVELKKGANETPPTALEWHDWFAHLDPERESILLHDDKVRTLLGTQLSAMLRVSSQVQWKELLERLRDIDSPNRLFEGHEALLKSYHDSLGITGTNTVSAIALLAVSLNNHAAFQNLPFKFCWSHIPLDHGKFTLFMAFGAWTSAEITSWKDMTPMVRMKGCSVWEGIILHSSEAISIPYVVEESVTLDKEQRAIIPINHHKCLVWASQVEVDGRKGDGELFIPDAKSYASRKQGITSKQVFELLSAWYFSTISKMRWVDLQHKVLEAIREKRKTGDKHRGTFMKGVEEKREGSKGLVAMRKKRAQEEIDTRLHKDV